MEIVQIKHCPICTQDLPISEFGICRARKDGRNLYCMSCIREKVRQSRIGRKNWRRNQKERRAKALELTMEQPSAPKPPIKNDDLVLEAIKNGARTQRAIQAETKLSKDVIGDALANLLLWTKEIRTQIVDGTRLYFPAEIEEKPVPEYKPVDPFCEVARKSNQLVVKEEKSIWRVA